MENAPAHATLRQTPHGLEAYCPNCGEVILRDVSSPRRSIVFGAAGAVVAHAEICAKDKTTP